MVWLLIALFCLIDLFSHAGIIYTERDNSDGADIIHLKSGRQVEGRLVRIELKLKLPAILVIKKIG